MSNFKKKYCLVSFIFAVIAVVVTLVAFVPQKAYAASVNIPGVTDSSNSNQSTENGNGTDGTAIMWKEIYPEQFGFFFELFLFILCRIIIVLIL
ncbi:MAG: hypothetical protein ACLT3R_06780 [Roseburia sp.]